MITLTAEITLANGEKITVDKRNMLSMGSKIIDRADINLPSWGIISNGGNIEFRDFNGEVLTYAENLYLQKGLPCSISLNDTLNKTSQEVSLFYTDQWNYDSDNKIVRVSVKDDLEEWQDIFVDGLEYNFKGDTQNLSYFYNYLFDKTPSKYNMTAFEDLDQDTKDVLEKNIVQFPMLERGNLWQQWTKLCVACQAHIFKNFKGKTMFVYNGGD